jgi:hypothetical protein
VLAFERAEHAGEVARGGDLGADAAAERLAACVAAEVVVPVAVGGLGDELELAGAGSSSITRFAQVDAVDLLPVAAAGVEVVERLGESGDAHAADLLGR